MASRDVRSSTGDLSSAPSSDGDGHSMSRPSSSHHSSTIHVARNAPSLLHPSAALGIKSEALPSTVPGAAPAKIRKPRKKKEVDPNAPEKEKKPRKPRTVTATTTASRKKQKIEPIESTTIPQHVSPPNSLLNSKLVEPVPFHNDTTIAPISEAAKYAQNGFSNHNSATNSQPQSPTFPRYQNNAPAVAAPPVSRSVFDPVRSIMTETSRPATYTAPLNETPPRPAPFRPSASPAISSIINHVEDKPTLSIPPPPALVPSVQTSSISRVTNLDGTSSNPMELDVPVQRDVLSRKLSSAEDKDASESDVKRKRAKEKPPPIPAGSGLLSSSFFGGESSIDKAADGKGANIVLHIDIRKGQNKDESKIINFARMAEDKYGFAALYPRQAAQKERLAKLAAAGAAIERSASNSKRGGSGAESGDDALSVDLDRESDNEGDVAMGGVTGTNENSGTDGPVPKQRRKRKEEEYDADDPFVDDSEMLWEAQAAASKDGFFVYMGPLVPEGEKPAVERADGTVKRGRGRGRGGGPGSRGGRGGAASAASAVTEGAGRGGGPGSRGGGVTRKPRIKKADRAQFEAEKKSREQAATLVAKPASYPAAA